MLPQLAASDPRLAIAHFAGKPVLMLAGKRDYLVTPDMVERLYEAAAEPKGIVWYDCGHLLTPEAYADAAAWIAGSARAEAGRQAGQRTAPGAKRAGQGASVDGGQAVPGARPA
jgi:alpha-beta hydrolase superfamily lysophospholipase